MKSLNADAKNFVNGIVDHLKKDKRGGRSIPKVQSLLRKVSESSWKDQTAKVITAVTLNQFEMEYVKNILSNMMNKDITIDCQVDPGILGGIRIEIGDSIIDLSFEEQLHDIQALLLNGYPI